MRGAIAPLFWDDGGGGIVSLIRHPREGGDPIFVFNGDE